MSRFEDAVRVRFVLVAPSHPGNIGSSARAILTMGFRGLHVVAPRIADFQTHPEAVALAAGAGDVLSGALTHADLMAALAGVSLSFAMTGYPREFGPPMVGVEAAAHRARAHLASEAGDVAFVFGCERNGLSNEDVERCSASCAIDADRLYGSLNLSQAVQIAAYACRVAGLAQGDSRRAAGGRAFVEEPLAEAPEMEGLMHHLSDALVAVGFLDPQSPRHLMSRVRRMLTRAALSKADVAILRGVCSAIIEPKSSRAGQGRSVAANHSKDQ